MTKFQTLTGLILLATAGIANAAQLTVHKSPYCSCCAKWIEHVEKHGFTVKVIESEQMGAVKKRVGVPDRLASCHTTEVGGYFIEGHVPAADIKRLLKEKPKAAGISVPGMPMGAPGMDETGHSQPFATVLVGRDGKFSIYARH